MITQLLLSPEIQPFKVGGRAKKWVESESGRLTSDSLLSKICFRILWALQSHRMRPIVLPVAPITSTGHLESFGASMLLFWWKNHVFQPKKWVETESKVSRADSLLPEISLRILWVLMSHRMHYGVASGGSWALKGCANWFPAKVSRPDSVSTQFRLTFWVEKHDFFIKKTI